MGFNILANKVLRYWLSITIDNDGACTITGLGHTVTDLLALLYADDTLIAATDPKWLQQAIDLLVHLFCHMCLDTNIEKTKLMLCDCGYIPTHLSDQAYLRKMTGNGPTFRDQLCHKITCPKCNGQMSQGFVAEAIGKRANLPDHPALETVQADIRDVPAVEESF